MRLSLNQHLFLATFFFMVILIVGILAVSHAAVLMGIENVEREAAPQTAEKIIAVLSLEEENLARIAYDWGVWDDTYEFVQNLDEEYIHSNLALSSLVGIQVNDILFFDTNGHLRYGVSSDYQSRTSRAVPSELVEYYYKSGLNRSTTGVSGIVPLQSGPEMIAIHPVVRSNESGEPRGMILIGRDLDDFRVAYLSNYTLYPFTLEMVNHEDGDTSPVEDQGLKSTGTNSVITSGTVTDIAGNPSFIARMEIPYYSPYTPEVLEMMIILVIALSALFFIAILLYFHHFFVRHISDLSEMLEMAVHPGSPVDPPDRTVPPEITRLAASAEQITKSLRQNRDDLTLSQERLEEAEERWHVLFEEVADPMCIGDQETLLDANDSWAELFGCDWSEVIHVPLRDLSLPLLSDGTNPIVSFMNQYYAVPEEGLIRFDWRVPDPDGRDLYFDVTIKIIMYQGNLLRFVVARDISVQVQMQEKQAVALARIDQNLVQLGTLNDEIRNPLTVIMGLVEDDPGKHAETIQRQVKQIDAIIDRLDRGYLDSEKVRNYLKRSFELGRR